jgi:hypothetical protein
MPVLQSENPNVETGKLAGWLLPVLRELRGSSFAVGWAIAALVATAGWFYFVARTMWYIVNLVFG